MEIISRFHGIWKSIITDYENVHMFHPYMFITDPEGNILCAGIGGILKIDKNFNYQLINFNLVP